MLMSRLRGFLAATAFVCSISTGALAGDALPQAVVQKLSDPAAIAAALADEEAPFVRVIVDVAMPTMPDIGTYASEDEADAALITASHRAQNQVIGRVFALEGGVEGVMGSGEAAERLNIRQMDILSRFAINADAEMLARLAADPDVLRIEPDREVELYLNQGNPTSLDVIQMPAAWAAGATGAGQNVAILDTGGRRTHKFLNARIVSAACYSAHNPGLDQYSLCPGSVQESTHIDSANDCDNTTIAGCGHGTHVAGTAAGFNNAPLAGEPLFGVARNAGIISINVFHRKQINCGSNFLSSGCVRATFFDIDKGLERVFLLRNTYNIAAVNMSLGGELHNTSCDSRNPSTTTLITNLRNAGIATVVAAGNDGSDTHVGWPACISNAIAVANTLKNDGLAASSNWGSLIDLVAPGTGIYASDVSGPSGNTWSFKNGTSMAAPHVAGAFAALKSVATSASVTQIENALKTTGVGITWAGFTKPRIRVNNALTSLGGAGTKAVMTSPSPNSTLAGSTVTFQWNAGAQAQAYWLYVGNTVGGFQYHDSGSIPTGTLSRQVTGLPTNGSTVRVRLFTRLGGTWQFNDYTYTAASGAGTKAVMTSPTPNSTLAGSTVTFQWNAGSGAQAYWLYVGNTVGGFQYHDSGQLGTGTLSRQVTGLPTNGSTVRVRLYTRLGGAWQFNDYTYTASSGGGVKAAITSPTPNSTLAGSTVTFQWNAGSGAQAYWLSAGSTVGGTQYFDSGSIPTGTLSRQVTNLPTNGSTVRVRLWTRLAGAWQFNDYTYTAATSAGTKAVMTSPSPGSTLAGSSVTFQWNTGSQAQAYWLYVGNTVGGAQYHDSGQLGTGTLSRTVSTLPINGSTVRVRLWTRLAGAWQFNDYTYTAATSAGTKAVMTSPSPGTTLPGSTVTFQWSAGSGAQSYWLYVGNTVGGFQYHDSGSIAAGTLSRQVTGLPTNGSTVRVRLWTMLGGAWQFNDYTYTASSGPVSTLITPANGTTISNPQTFMWTSVSGATEYWVDFGSTQGGTNYLTGSRGLGTSMTVSWTGSAGLPLHMRLWTRHGGTWRFVDYQFFTPAGDPGPASMDVSGLSVGGPIVAVSDSPR
jgi:serine protease